MITPSSHPRLSYETTRKLLTTGVDFWLDHPDDLFATANGVVMGALLRKRNRGRARYLVLVSEFLDNSTTSPLREVSYRSVVQGDPPREFLRITRLTGELSRDVLKATYEPVDVTRFTSDPVWATQTKTDLFLNAVRLLTELLRNQPHPVGRVDTVPTTEPHLGQYLVVGVDPQQVIEIRYDLSVLLADARFRYKNLY